MYDAYLEERCPGNQGWIHEDDLPDLDYAKDMLHGVRNAIYETGDIENLEDCLKELLAIFKLNMPKEEPLLEKKGKLNQKIKTENHMNNKQLLVNDESQNLLIELENTQKMCKLLLQTPHYAKLGNAGLYAIVEKAKSMGINPMNALNGGFYFVQGKVEMTAVMMNELIRNAGHSITKDKNSNETICILHGKRKDTNDTWMESFSIEDAKLAGIYRNQWLKYPKDMLFARALSRLARQLFPDILKGCFVQGEISEAPPINSPVEEEKEELLTASPLEIVELEKFLDAEYKERITQFLSKNMNIQSFNDIPKKLYDKFLQNAKNRYNERQSQITEVIEVKAGA